ncbi:MAG: Antitoxin HicB [Legionellaceae bacterium]
MNILYPAYIKQEDERYTVYFPDLEEAITEGETLEEAFFQAAEVLTLTLEGRMEEGIPIPEPSNLKDTYLISPSARVQAALLLKLAKGEHTNSELARTLETSWASISRLENPQHWPSLRQLERVAAALGQRLIISLEPNIR